MAGGGEKMANKFLEAAFRTLNETARDRDVDIHDSFKIELENYTLHRKVRSLSTGVKQKVIESLGKMVIDAASKQVNKVGGHHVRLAIVSICDDPFSDCFGVAQRILNKDSRIVRDLGRAYSAIDLRRTAAGSAKITSEE